ncbi:hypothetical protein H4S00_001894 [Coemansia sp. D1744]|nr:hypothetical protein H4S00_001894 [Coemansia sp. D1744]
MTGLIHCCVTLSGLVLFVTANHNIKVSHAPSHKERDDAYTGYNHASKYKDSENYYSVEQYKDSYPEADVSWDDNIEWPAKTMYHDYQEKQRPEKYNDHEPAHTKRPVQIINSYVTYIDEHYFTNEISVYPSEVPCTYPACSLKSYHPYPVYPVKTYYPYPMYPVETYHPYPVYSSEVPHSYTGLVVTNWYMSAQSSAFASDHIFGNGWMPGSTRRTVVKEADSTWNIGRNDRSVSISCALGISLFIALLGTILQLSS